MNERERMMKMIGWEVEDTKRLNEMSISKIDWAWDEDGKPSQKEIDMSAREFAKLVIIDKLDTVGYWTESFSEEKDKMTPRELKMVNEHIDKFVSRIFNMLKPKYR